MDIIDDDIIPDVIGYGRDKASMIYCLEEKIILKFHIEQEATPMNFFISGSYSFGLSPIL